MPKARKAEEISSSILSGLEEASLHAKGELDLPERNLMVAPLPKFKGKSIKALRNKLKLTQETMAMALGVSVKTVEAWESGRNIPQGPAQRMLGLLNMNPELLQDFEIVVQS